MRGWKVSVMERQGIDSKILLHPKKLTWNLIFLQIFWNIFLCTFKRERPRGTVSLRWCLAIVLGINCAGFPTLFCASVYPFVKWGHAFCLIWWFLGITESRWGLLFSQQPNRVVDVLYWASRTVCAGVAGRLKGKSWSGVKTACRNIICGLELLESKAWVEEFRSETVLDFIARIKLDLFISSIYQGQNWVGEGRVVLRALPWRWMILSDSMGSSLVKTQTQD